MDKFIHRSYMDLNPCLEFGMETDIFHMGLSINGSVPNIFDWD